MTTLSRISMAAVAALIVGMGPASAADLGGNCCADLEERVAELEATTARKGTRKVSLTISGQISQELLFWDDGFQDDMYVTGSGPSNSRFRMLGSAKISPEVTAGFLYELQFYASVNSSVNQTNGGDDLGHQGLGVAPASGQSLLREANAWIEHRRLGRITIGQGNTAATNSMLVDLSGKGNGSSNFIGLHAGGMFIHSGSGGFGGYVDATWADFIGGGYDWLNGRHEHIQYRTPMIAGFTLGASYGEDNYWDVALRYAGEFNGIRIAGAVSYSVNSEFNQPRENTPAGLVCTYNCDREVRQWTGSLSVRHMPTGLFFTGAAGTRDVKHDQVGPQDPPFSYDADFYYLSGGIARNFFGLGDTVLYGEWGVYSGLGQQAYGPIARHTDLEHWGLGITQHIDAAAMEVFVTYKNLSLSGPTGYLISLDEFSSGADDYHMISVGTRIRF